MTIPIKVWVCGGMLVVAAVIGLASIAPARAAFEAMMSCAQTSPCLEWDNSKSGDALKGVSSKGNAVHGQTKFKSAGQSAGKAGVLGEDLSTSGTLNAGVSGVSTNGAGVMGASTSYNAVEGLSTNSTGVYGQTGNAGGYGVAGRNVATTHSNNGAGLLADGGAANDGLHAFAGGANSVGVYAYSDLGTSLNLNQGPNDTAPALFMHATGPTHDLIQITDQGGSDILALDASPLMLLHGQMQATSTSGTTAIFSNYPGNHFPAMLLYAGTSGTGQPVFNVSDDLLNQELSVTDQGDLYIHGLMFSGGSCHSGCLTGNDQTRSVREYSPVESEPTIEDNGEAALVDGRADVALDPKFANVIDTTKPYLVTITPEGDSNGLYVANRSAAGFSVRESKGGRSNIGFVYRIVARRYGVDAPRLPMTVIRHASPPARDTHHHH